MEKKILIDASQAKQTRVAITNNGNVDGYEFENINKYLLFQSVILGFFLNFRLYLSIDFVSFPL